RDGTALDFEAFTSNPTTGAVSLAEGAQIETSSQSSGATAMTAGIAALVWSKYPNWTREQVLSRMQYCSRYMTWTPQRGYGFVDAICAVKDPLPTSLGSVLQWNAQDPSLGHLIGRADGSGWSVNVVQDGEGFLQYGPYTGVPTGNNVALWNFLIDDNSANNDHILVLDVFDATTLTEIASRVITRQQFAAANTFQIFALPFTVDGSRAGHVWE